MKRRRSSRVDIARGLISVAVMLTPPLNAGLPRLVRANALAGNSETYPQPRLGLNDILFLSKSSSKQSFNCGKAVRRNVGLGSQTI
jgi:hypothetical protein